MEKWSIYFRDYDDKSKLSVSYTDEAGTHTLKMTQPGVLEFVTSDIARDFVVLGSYGIKSAVYSGKIETQLEEELYEPTK
jgi:hypothetical protein